MEGNKKFFPNFLLNGFEEFHEKYKEWKVNGNSQFYEVETNYNGIKRQNKSHEWNSCRSSILINHAIREGVFFEKSEGFKEGSIQLLYNKTGGLKEIFEGVFDENNKYEYKYKNNYICKLKDKIKLDDENLGEFIKIVGRDEGEGIRKEIGEIFKIQGDNKMKDEAFAKIFKKYQEAVKKLIQWAKEGENEEKQNKEKKAFATLLAYQLFRQIRFVKQVTGARLEEELTYWNMLERKQKGETKEETDDSKTRQFKSIFDGNSDTNHLKVVLSGEEEREETESINSKSKMEYSYNYDEKYSIPEISLSYSQSESESSDGDENCNNSSQENSKSKKNNDLGDSEFFKKVIFITTAERDKKLKEESDNSFKKDVLYIEFTPSEDQDKAGLAFFYQGERGALNYFPNSNDVSKTELLKKLQSIQLETTAKAGSLKKPKEDLALEVFKGSKQISNKYDISNVQNELKDVLKNKKSQQIELKNLKKDCNYVEYSKNGGKHIFNFPQAASKDKYFFDKLQTVWYVPVKNQTNTYAKIKIKKDGEYEIQDFYKSQDLEKPNEDSMEKAEYQQDAILNVEINFGSSQKEPGRTNIKKPKQKEQQFDGKNFNLNI